MDIETTLQELGLSKYESKIYLSLLKLGPSSAYKISKDCSLFKANTYEALEKLRKKGLISRLVSKKTTLYQIEEVNDLKELLRKKNIILNEALPLLKEIKNKSNEKNEPYIKDGLNGFMNI